jgi:hypothetical protein
MAVAVVMDFTGATLDQYDKVVELMHLTPNGAGARGGLFHWVTKTDDGIRVTDVWESRAQFDSFAAEQIGPHTQQAGIPAPPQITFHDVHSYMTEG